MQIFLKTSFSVFTVNNIIADGVDVEFDLPLEL